MGVVSVGIDPSYTCTALVALESNWAASPDQLRQAQSIRTEKAKWVSHPARLAHIRDKVLQFVDDWQSALVCIEGYAHGAKFHREAAGELGGVLRVALWEAGFGYANVAPPTLKKFVTGKGNAHKDVMLREVYRKWGYEAKDDNDCDAYGLAQLAKAMLIPKENWTKTFTQLVKKIEVVEPR